MTRWGIYVEGRLGELERGEGDYTGLRQPSAVTVAHARQLAAGTFRDSTPTPSVVPTEDGGIDFVWRKNGYNVEITVTETAAEIWATGGDWEMWDSMSLPDHEGCCLTRALDVLEK